MPLGGAILQASYQVEEGLDGAGSGSCVPCPNCPQTGCGPQCPCPQCPQTGCGPQCPCPNGCPGRQAASGCASGCISGAVIGHACGGGSLVAGCGDACPKTGAECADGVNIGDVLADLFADLFDLAASCCGIPAGPGYDDCPPCPYRGESGPNHPAAIERCLPAPASCTVPCPGLACPQTCLPYNQMMPMPAPMPPMPPISMPMPPMPPIAMPMPNPMPMPPMPPMPYPMPMPMPPPPPVVTYVAVPQPVVTVIRCVQQEGHGRLEVENGSAIKMTCHKLTLKTSGGESIVVAAGKSHVIITGEHFRAVADRVTTDGGQGLLLEKVSVHSLASPHRKVYADQVSVEKAVELIKLKPCDRPH
jgi:hypothetical protein